MRAPIEKPEREDGAFSREEPPPFLRSWRNVYLLVIGELAALVALFWALTRWAS